jgi:putative heme-binding domain-containing protein
MAALAAGALAAAMAVRVSAQISSQDHPGQYDRADIEAGSRLYGAQCAGCHGANGDMVSGIDLRRGQFRSAVSDEDLARALATGRPASGMPAFATLQPREVTGIIAFIRAGFDAAGTAVKVGDPGRGRILFSGKGACATCHRVNGSGSYVAADLSDIGAVWSAGSLQRALLDPSGTLLPANRRVRAVTRDGRTINGRRLNEDTVTIQVIDDQARLVSLTKADLRTLEILPTSSMPSFATTFTTDEAADVIAYLLSLKGL